MQRRKHRIIIRFHRLKIFQKLVQHLIKYYKLLRVDPLVRVLQKRLDHFHDPLGLLFSLFRQKIAGVIPPCRAFLAHLLSVETQTSLTVAGALPVLEGLTIYAGESGYEALEAAASLPLLVPPVFGTSGRETLDAVAGAFWSGQISAYEGIERLRAAFAR